MNHRISGCHTEPTEEEVEASRRHWSTDTKVVICPTCKGRGYTQRKELIDYHRRDWGVFREACTVCNCFGLVRVTTRQVMMTTTTSVPYDAKTALSTERL